MTTTFEIGQKVNFTSDSILNMSNPELIDLSVDYTVITLNPVVVEDNYCNCQRVAKKDYKYLKLVTA